MDSGQQQGHIDSGAYNNILEFLWTGRLHTILNMKKNTRKN